MIRTATLKSAIALVKGSLGRKKSLTDIVMSLHVELSAERHLMTLTATNLEKSSRAVLPYHGTQSATFMLEPIGISAINRLAEADCSIALNGGNVSISSGRVNIRLPTKDADTFPEIDHWENVTWSDMVSSEYLESIFYSVSHAVSRDPARPALNGIRIINDGKMLKAFATDGHRLSMYCAEDSPLQTMLLPSSALSSIATSVKSTVGVHVSTHSSTRKDALYASSERVLALKGSTVVGDGEDEELDEEITFFHSFRLMESATFPPVDTIIEQMKEPLDKSIRFNIAPIRSAIDIAKMFDEAQRCIISFSGRKMNIDAESSLGAANIELDLLEVPAEAVASLRVGVNAKYILDALSSCLDDEVTLRLYDSQKPMLVDDGSKQELIMPMRV